MLLVTWGNDDETLIFLLWCPEQKPELCDLFASLELQSTGCCKIRKCCDPSQNKSYKKGLTKSCLRPPLLNKALCYELKSRSSKVSLPSADRPVVEELGRNGRTTGESAFYLIWPVLCRKSFS